MQAILYRDSPYSILWYKLNLQAWRTDTWTGYHLVPEQDGAPFWNMMRTTYIDLQPEERDRGGVVGIVRLDRRARHHRGGRGGRRRAPAPAPSQGRGGLSI